jgi:hypothetical protein
LATPVHAGVASRNKNVSLVVMRALCSTPGVSKLKEELSMKKIILVGLAILAVSTSGALAKKATKPKAPAAAATTTTTTTAAPLMLGQVSAADRELYEKSQRESGMKK